MTEAAKKMRDMDIEDRNAAIDDSPNVFDLRPQLNQKRRNQALADFYKQAKSSRPPDGLA